MTKLIMVPTYNESKNVGRLLSEIAVLQVDADLLIVDDNSPDGTGQVVEDLKALYPRLSVMHRKSKDGIGSAHLAGIAYAYEHGYQRLLTMDCDFTHPTEYIPDFFKEVENADVVVANRYFKMDAISDWPLHRRLVTQVAHLMTSLVLGMKFDATGAYRCYNLQRISRQLFNQVESMGYAFFFESLYVLWKSGAEIREIGTHLPIRTDGESKMTGAEFIRSLKMLGKLFLLRLRKDFGR